MNWVVSKTVLENTTVRPAVGLALFHVEVLYEECYTFTVYLERILQINVI